MKVGCEDADGSGEAESTPDVRLALVALGVWVAALVSLYTSVWWGVGMAAAGAVAAWWCRRSRRGWVVVMGAVAIGVTGGAMTASAQLAVRDAEPFHAWVVEGRAATVTVTVAGDPLRVRSAAEPTYRIPVRVTRARVGEVTVGLSVRAVVFAVEGDRSRWATLLPGQVVTVTGRLSPGEPGELDAAKVSVDRKRPTLRGEPPWWQTAAGDLRAGLRRVCADLPAEPGGLLPGLALGDVSALEPDVDADFRDAGMTHLLAVSGAKDEKGGGSIASSISLLICWSDGRDAPTSEETVTTGHHLCANPDDLLSHGGVAPDSERDSRVLD